jgi:hypothetical protein
MKGIVFTEFIEMVEDVFSPDMADQIINDSNLYSDGAYTAVGTYDHHEMLAMVTRLSELTSMSVPDLVQAFGKHLLQRFTVLYPEFFNEVDDTFSFLDSIENHVHVEVLKLYPDAELPNFNVHHPDSNSLVMTYKSSRPFAVLAQGLIKGAADYFSENISVAMIDLSNGEGNHARFELKKEEG